VVDEVEGEMEVDGNCVGLRVVANVGLLETLGLKVGIADGFHDGVAVLGRADGTAIGTLLGIGGVGPALGTGLGSVKVNVGIILTVP